MPARQVVGSHDWDQARADNALASALAAPSRAEQFRLADLAAAPIRKAREERAQAILKAQRARERHIALRNMILREIAVQRNVSPDEAKRMLAQTLRRRSWD